MTLYKGVLRIECSNFCAGAEYNAGRVTKTAPILAWTKGLLVTEVLARVKRYRPEAIIYLHNERRHDERETY